MKKSEKKDIVVIKDKTLTKKTTIRKRDKRFQIEQQFKLVWENSLDGMRMIDDNGNIIMVNNAFCTLVEKSESELLNRHFSIIYLEENQKSMVEKSGERFKAHRVEPHLERELELWNGKKVWFELSNSYLDFEGDGSFLLSIFRDISKRKQIEFELNREQKKYYSLISKLPDMVFVRLKDKIVYANEAILKTLEITSDQLYGKSFLSFIPDEFKELVIMNMKRRDNGEEVEEYETDVIITHNSRKRVIVRAENILFEGYEATLIVLVDVTEIRKSEELLKLSEAMLKATFDNTVHSIILLDNNGLIKSFNDSANRRALGLSYKELETNAKIFGYFSGSNRENLEINFKDVLNGKKIKSEEIFYLENDNRLFFETYLSPVKTSTGEILGACYSAVDITEHINVKEMLELEMSAQEVITKISQEFINFSETSLPDKINDSLKLVGKFLHVDGVFSFIKTLHNNDFHEEKYFWLDDRFRKYDTGSFLSFNTLDSVFQSINYNNTVSIISLSDPENKNIIKYFEERDTKIRSIIYYPIFRDNNIDGYIGFFNLEEERFWNERDNLFLRLICDIYSNVITKLIYEKIIKRNTEELTKMNIIFEFKNQELDNVNRQMQKSEQELVELNASKDKFFSIIAHDLKSPFMGLIGYSSILIEDFEILEKKQLKHFVENINKIARNVYELIENLLDYSRLQTSKMIYQPIKIGLRNKLIEISNSLMGNLIKKNITFNNSVNEPVEVLADENMLNSLLVNLVSNAIKFTPSQGSITVEAVKELNFYRISIKDTGIGIRKEDISKLFRIDTTFTTYGTNQEQGTGLGLILCRELVKKHGGEIWVESEVNVGTIFYFTIPAV